jgi:5-methylcytosine-specific restriction endonuclease McrA
MPIRPENKARYPKDWPAISRAIRARAGNRCEWCAATNGEPHPITLSRVVLTVAHLDHTPENCSPENLKALCQRCHNRYDAPVRRAGIIARRRARSAVSDLFPPLSHINGGVGCLATGRNQPGKCQK